MSSLPVTATSHTFSARWRWWFMISGAAWSCIVVVAAAVPAGSRAASVRVAAAP